jgi:hypothetical protein
MKRVIALSSGADAFDMFILVVVLTDASFVSSDTSWHWCQGYGHQCKTLICLATFNLPLRPPLLRQKMHSNTVRRWAHLPTRICWMRAKRKAETVSVCVSLTGGPGTLLSHCMQAALACVLDASTAARSMHAAEAAPCCHPAPLCCSCAPAPGV